MSPSACCPETPLHGGGKGLQDVDQASLPTVAILEHNVRHFLGYYMIKKFDVLNFLEDTGVGRLCTGLGERQRGSLEVNEGHYF